MASVEDACKACPSKRTLFFAIMLLERLIVTLAMSVSQHHLADPYSKVNVQVVGGSAETSSAEPSETHGGNLAGRSRKFLIASFPRMRQVAYAHLPDNVWRPLVVGEVARPSSLAVDRQRARLFVADPASKVIWIYSLTVSPSGFLQTVGGQAAAVENVEAQWLAVNSVGDLYYTAKHLIANSDSYSVWRHDAAKIARGNTRNSTEVYNRFNTGATNPRAWKPAGVAADSLYIYWGNAEDGTSHGSVVKANRENVGLLSQEKQIKPLSFAADDVRGVAVTGTHLFFVSPIGVHGVLKSTPQPVRGTSDGLVATSREAGGDSFGTTPWDPQSIAWDGDNTLYFSDVANGKIFEVPSLNILQHHVSKYADAPGVHSVTFVGFAGASTSTAYSKPWNMVTLAACLISFSSTQWT